MSIAPSKLWDFFEVFLNPHFHQFFVANSLICQSFFEEFIEVKIILHKEFYTTCVKLHDFLIHHLRIRKYVEIEWTHRVSFNCFIPFECDKTNLKRVHPLTIVL